MDPREESSLHSVACILKHLTDGVNTYETEISTIKSKMNSSNIMTWICNSIFNRKSATTFTDMSRNVKSSCLEMISCRFDYDEKTKREDLVESNDVFHTRIWTFSVEVFFFPLINFTVFWIICSLYEMTNSSLNKLYVLVLITVVTSFFKRYCIFLIFHYYSVKFFHIASEFIPRSCKISLLRIFRIMSTILRW